VRQRRVSGRGHTHCRGVTPILTRCVSLIGGGPWVGTARRRISAAARPDVCVEGVLPKAHVERESRLPGATAWPLAMVGHQDTDQQQRMFKKGLLAAIEADVEATAGLLATAKRAQFDRAMECSERVGISPRDSRFAVAADADMYPSDG